jgi:hypothetical protein
MRFVLDDLKRSSSCTSPWLPKILIIKLIKASYDYIVGATLEK